VNCLKELPQHSPRETEEKHGNSVRMADNLVEIPE
jgi:hypothetical protein